MTRRNCGREGTADAGAVATVRERLRALSTVEGNLDEVMRAVVTEAAEVVGGIVEENST